MDNNLNKRLYTNVFQRGNTFYVRGVEDEKRFEYKEVFKPTLYTSSNTTELYKDVYGKFVRPIHFDNVKEAKQFINQYNDDENLTVYGMDTFEYQLTNKDFGYDLSNIDRNSIKIYAIDIEVFSGINGPFPSPYKTENIINENGIEETEITPLALYPIPMMTIKTWDNETILFTSTPYEHDENHPNIGDLDVQVQRFDSEEEMLLGFLYWWSNNPPDIITGWNSTLFDMPYIVNRIKRLAERNDYIDLHSVSNGVYEKCKSNPLFKNKNVYKLLSPWKCVNEKKGKDRFENEIKYYQFAGVSLLDYFDLYKKFTFVTQTEYTLKHITSVELGTTKLEFTENDLNEFFINNVQRYTEYNIQDANLIQLLDQKLKLIDTVFTLSYESRCNYEDALGTIRPWDALIYGMLNTRNVVVPLSTNKVKIRYPGAFVKTPIAGKYGFTVSFDFKSLYPHVFMQWNIGPDTILSDDQVPREVREAITYKPTVEWLENSTERCVVHGLDDLVQKKENLDILKKYKICMAANGTYFRTDIVSIFSEKVEEIYADRSKAKGEMNRLKAKKEREKETLTKEELISINSKIDRLDVKQMAYKIFMNSLYGATGTAYFRWYNNDIASATTISAQLANRWIMRKFNQLLNKILNTDDKDYVIYGDTDSTLGTTKIKYRKYNKDYEVCIKDLYDKLAENFMKNDPENHNWTKFANDIKTISYNTTTNELEHKPIKYVKKHKVKKEMFRLTVEDKVVEITCDHSLMVERDNKVIEIKPQDVVNSDKFIKLIENT